MNTSAALKSIIISAALAGLGVAGAAEQKATFAVAITLHAISKPMAAAQLCSEGKPLDRVSGAISVSCPVLRYGQASASAADSGLPTGATSTTGATVIVTF